MYYTQQAIEKKLGGRKSKHIISTALDPKQFDEMFLFWKWRVACEAAQCERWAEWRWGGEVCGADDKGVIVVLGYTATQSAWNSIQTFNRGFVPPALVYLDLIRWRNDVTGSCTSISTASLHFLLDCAPEDEDGGESGNYKELIWKGYTFHFKVDSTTSCKL